MTEKNRESESGKNVQPEHGEQAEILADTSEAGKKARPELARDRQPKPEDAKKLKESIESEPKDPPDEQSE